MGNSATKEALEEVEHRSLDLSRKLSPVEYLKHINGEFLEGQLTAIPWEVHYTVSMYETVNVSFNFINTIPDELCLHCPHLKIFDISHNQLVSLPETFHLLLHLHTLDLSYNRIKIFPSCILKLENLYSLNMSYNELKEIPPSISKLKKLKKLNLSNNKLGALPNSLSECSNLTIVVTRNNGLIHPPQAICDEGSHVLLQFLRERHTPAVQEKVEFIPIFSRIRGEQVLASVNNPDSANTEYRQAQGTARTNKRKCPLMHPADSSTLTPAKFREVLLGLIYGSVLGDSMALYTEGLTKDECHFFYTASKLNVQTCVRDKLRSHFPPNDWSSSSDIMLLMLESLMRWGGVVDELEFASQLDQWRIHGFVDIDPLPGYPLSPLMSLIIASPGYAIKPHINAEAAYKHHQSNNSRGIHSNINTSDNSCLSCALVLGIPNFYKENEVMMNAERICKSTHADPVAVASCLVVALIVAQILQGNFEFSNFDELIKKSSTCIRDEILREKYISILLEENSRVPTNDCIRTIQLLKRELCKENIKFIDSLTNVIMEAGDGACGHGTVVGGILGAVIGYSNLPQDKLHKLPTNNTKWLNNKLNILLDLFGLP